MAHDTGGNEAVHRTRQVRAVLFDGTSRQHDDGVFAVGERGDFCPTEVGQVAVSGGVAVQHEGSVLNPKTRTNTQHPVRTEVFLPTVLRYRRESCVDPSIPQGERVAVCVPSFYAEELFNGKYAVASTSTKMSALGNMALTSTTVDAGGSPLKNSLRTRL